MVNVLDKVKSEFISLDEVKNSPTKILVPIGEGGDQETEWGTKLVIPVQMDKQDYKWIPNKSTMQNFIDNNLNDTKSWVGVKVKLIITKSSKGKEMIDGFPISVSTNPI